jgi:hypothetical protein
LGISKQLQILGLPTIFIPYPLILFFNLLFILYKFFLTDSPNLRNMHETSFAAFTASAKEFLAKP